MHKNKIWNRFNIFLILTVIYGLMIFYLSSKSALPQPVDIELHFFYKIARLIENSKFDFLFYPFYFIYLNFDKFEHIILYAGFGFLLYLTLSNSRNTSTRKYAIILAILIGALYGVTDEIHQSFVPSRSASIMDLFADVIGVAFAQVIIFFFNKKYTK